MSEPKSVTITVNEQGNISWILVGQWWPFEVAGICALTAQLANAGYFTGEPTPKQTAGADIPADARQEETEKEDK